MAWLESHQELAGHPKTKRAARHLGVAIPHLIGHLHCLWWWAMDYAQDGDLSDFTDEDIADAARWENDPGALVIALTECGIGGGAGFLTRDRCLNDWDQYGGKYLKRRQQARERQRKHREQQGDSKGSHDAVTRDERVSHTARGQDIREQDKTEEGAALEASTDAAVDEPVMTELSEHEQVVAGLVKEVRGMTKVKPEDIIAHMRECLSDRAAPVGAETMRREMRKFRDHHGPRRLTQPVSKPWRGWKNAIANWVERIPDDAPDGPGVVYPDFSDPAHARWTEDD